MGPKFTVEGQCWQGMEVFVNLQDMVGGKKFCCPAVFSNQKNGNLCVWNTPMENYYDLFISA